MQSGPHLLSADVQVSAISPAVTVSLSLKRSAYLLPSVDRQTLASELPPNLYTAKLN